MPIEQKDLESHDIAFILGLWSTIVGGKKARQLVPTCDEWCQELKRGEFGANYIRMMDSKYGVDCDLSLAISPEGNVYAVACELVTIITDEDRLAHGAAQNFIRAVSDLS